MPPRKREIDIKGLEQVRRNLESFKHKSIRETRKGLLMSAELIMTQSKKIVPVDTGALRSTGHVAPLKESPGKFEVELGYGGPAGSGVVRERSATGQYTGATTTTKAVGYAIWVHERLELHHKVGESKYLQKPFETAAPAVATQIGEELRKVVESYHGA